MRRGLDLRETWKLRQEIAPATPCPACGAQLVRGEGWEQCPRCQWTHATMAQSTLGDMYGLDGEPWAALGPWRHAHSDPAYEPPAPK